MSRYLTLLLSATLAISACQDKSKSELKQNLPNILILIADDAGWRDFGCYGNPFIATPSIDALAANGFKAGNAFLTIAQCSPSRISILTGKYPHSTGAEDLHMPLPETETILPTYLKPAGYYSGVLKKVHLGPHGQNQFDWYSQDLDDFDVFLDSAGTAPFLMWVGFSDPHRPYAKDIIPSPQTPDRVIIPPYLNDDQATREDLADYYNEIRRMDMQIGQYLRILRDRNLLDNTLIIFFSDNGAPFPRAKGTLYDSGIKTPLIFNWPDVIQKGIVYEPLISIVDLTPTLLEIAGQPLPSLIQSRSIFSLLKDPTLPGRPYVYSERNWHNCDEHMRSIRSEKYKLISNAYTELPFGSPSDISSSPSWKNLYTLKLQNKLDPKQAQIFQVPRPAWELYDLQKDPDELINLADEPSYREILTHLQDELERWRIETSDFSPEERRRKDNTDRVTGIKFDQTSLPAQPGSFN